jgi:hypothetical protein
MKKIIAILLVFNSADSILNCLKSLEERVDEIHCFDGRWKGFPYPSDHSDDETKDIILKFAEMSQTSVYFFPLSVMHQHEARTESMKHVKDGDWIFILDTDEIVKTWDDKVIRQTIETTTERGFKVCFRYPKPACAYPTYRFFYKTPNIHFSTDHRRVFDDNGELDLAHFNALTAIVIDHMIITDKKRMRKYMEEYKTWLYQYEQAHQVN